MKNFTIILALGCLSVVTGSIAQTGSAPVSAPSSVSEVAAKTSPLVGTLFFDPQQRQRLDRARQRGGIPVDAATEDSVATVLNGFVKRSDGQTAIWVDGRPRFNVQGENALRLQPGDVGGPAGTVKVISSSAATPSRVGNTPRINKASQRKPVPKRAPKRPSASR